MSQRMVLGDSADRIARRTDDYTDRRRALIHALVDALDIETACRTPDLSYTELCVSAPCVMLRGELAEAVTAFLVAMRSLRAEIYLAAHREGVSLPRLARMIGMSRQALTRLVRDAEASRPPDLRPLEDLVGAPLTAPRPGLFDQLLDSFRTDARATVRAVEGMTGP